MRCSSLVLLDPRVLGPVQGWRAGFLLGAVLALAILLVRRNVPESPRWLLAHGRAAEAERIVAQIEQVPSGHRPPEAATHTVAFGGRAVPTLAEVAHVLLRRYPNAAPSCWR